MLTAIGPAISSSLATGNKSGSALDGQLAKYQIQLADWVSCSSCKTPEGKAKIAEIESKIKDIQQQMAGSDGTAVVNPTTQSTSDVPVNRVSASQRANSMVGSRLNIFA
jgi:capsule polysaccharide export protein KpsE/RkpR